MKKLVLVSLLMVFLVGCSNIQPASYVVNRACQLEGAKAVLVKETLDEAVHPHRVTVECFAFTEEINDGGDETDQTESVQ